jgi:CSLREA domain-containing protein
VGTNSLDVGDRLQGVDYSLTGSWVYAVPSASVTAPTDFGRTALGTTRTQNVTVTNNGQDFSLLTGGFPNSFSNAAFSGTGGCLNLEKSATSNATVSFSPTSAGNHAGSGAVSGNGGAPTVNVQGIGVSKLVLVNPTVAFGNTLTGATLQTSPTLAQQGALDSFATQPTVSAAGASDGSVTVAAGAAFTFNVSATSTARNVSANFSSAGSKSGVVALAVTPEFGGTASEGAYALGVAYTAEVFSLPVATAGAGPFSPGQPVSFTLSGGTRPADARLDSFTLTQPSVGAFAIPGLSAGTSTIPAQGALTSANITFATAANILNGLPVSGSFTAQFTSVAPSGGALAGSVPGDAGSVSRTLAVTTGGNIAPIHRSGGPDDFAAGQTAPLAASGNYSGLSSTTVAQAADAGGRAASGSTAALLDTDSLNISQTAAMAWRARTATENTPPGLFSDVVKVSGLGARIRVISVAYDPALLNAAGFTPNRLMLGRRDVNGVWTRAILGNSGQGAQFTGQSELASFSRNSSATLAPHLGRFGVDTAAARVWAVVDFDGTFAVSLAPNPSLVVTTANDEDNGNSDPLFGSGTSLREAVAFANSFNDGQPRIITFAANLAG